ncbi:Oidioi.mRNA.OKI2018_I69.chr1.g1791.t1.cds [Oikopleura dioica]|uniref:Protein S100 n=1 Tax=Oikopleura dioica TaxID=34765 RepID=A0ABN7SU22_OIKDI|nr:Oidioi.mRNA.OKI2018_I69.chr1.g1791.t1.cds [Oikopleura dioica]
MSALQSAMAGLISVFAKHCGQDQALNKEELKNLLETEFGSMLGNSKDKNVVDEIFKGLDQDGNGSVNFTEFVTMVAALTAATNEMLCSQ